MRSEHMRLLSAFTLLMFAAAPFRSQASKSPEQGGQIFEQLCVGCHGSDGHATTDMGKKVQAADLTSEAVQQQSDSQLTKVIKNGQKKMPSFADKLSDDDIGNVLAFVRQFGKKGK
jgi:mono/diheme cytochrome c family protein